MNPRYLLTSSSVTASLAQSNDDAQFNFDLQVAIHGSIPGSDNQSGGVYVPEESGGIVPGHGNGFSSLDPPGLGYLSLLHPHRRRSIRFIPKRTNLWIIILGHIRKHTRERRPLPASPRLFAPLPIPRPELSRNVNKLRKYHHMPIDIKWCTYQCLRNDARHHPSFNYSAAGDEANYPFRKRYQALAP